MPEYCPDCFGKLDALHFCGEKTSERKGENLGASTWYANQSIGNFIVLAPLGGIALDMVVPLPSSLIHSIILSIIGSALASVIWISIKYEGQKGLNFFLKNTKNLLFTPNLAKIFGTQSKKNLSTSWIVSIIVATSLQILIFSPGNAAYLSNRVEAKIDDASGANLSVECPGLQLYLYNRSIECRVKTGILGITVPARANLSPIFGSSQIKISLL